MTEKEIVRESVGTSRYLRGRLVLLLLGIMLVISLTVAGVASFIAYKTVQQQAVSATSFAERVKLACEDPSQNQTPEIRRLCGEAEQVVEQAPTTIIEGTQGPRGPQGLQGARGERGPQGDTGPIGPRGPRGNQGRTGEAGTQGAQGDTGSTGSTGSQGEQGNRGPQGEQGPQGERGPQGQQGERGATGERGPAGADAPRIVDLRFEGDATSCSLVVTMSDDTVYNVESPGLLCTVGSDDGDEG